MKKTLLSIALVGFAFVASSQTTIFKDNFNSYTIGNLSTGFDPMTEGQGGWFTETLSFGDNAATQIVSVGANDNALQISGYDGPSTTSPTPSANRTVFRSLNTEWASRPSGQNTIVVKFQMKIPALSSSKNSFSSFLTDASGNRLVGVNFNPSTRKLIAIGSVVIPAQGSNPAENYYGAPFNLYWNEQAEAYEPLILPDDESIVDVIFKFNKDNGQFWVEVIGDAMVNGVSTPGVDSYYYSNPNADNDALKAVDPVEIMFSASAGTGNTSSESISYDELFITSESCLISNDSQFKYDNQQACVGSANLTPSVNNPYATGVFTVTPSTGLVINPTTGEINVSTATPGTYTIKYVTDAVPNYGICSDFHTEQIEIKSSPVATISASGATTFCQGSPVQVTLTSSTGNSYEWKKDATTLGSSNTQAVTEAGSYTVKVTGSNGCSTISSPTVVSLNPIVTPHFNSVSVCTGSTASLPTSSTDATPITGTWTPPVAPITTATTYTFHPDANQCVTQTPVTSLVSINSLPTATISTTGSTTICEGGSITLTSSQGVSYEWKKEATVLGTSSTQSATAQGSYTVKVTDANGCSAVSSPTNVSVNSLPTASISTNTSTTFCQGSSVLLTSSTGNSYEWKKDATVLGSLNTQSATESGNYTVKVTDVNGCSAVSSPTVVTVNAKVTPTFNLSDNVYKGAAAITLPTSSTNVPAITGTWSKGSSSAIVSSIATSTLGAIVYTFTPSSSFCATNFTKTINCVVGIEEAIISPFTIYPNPTNDVISVSFSELTSRNGTIRFISADGKLIESREFTNSSVETFDVKSLNPGIYFLQIDNSIEKVIVQ